MSFLVCDMYVCLLSDLDIMLAFQHGCSTVHGFPIADLLIPLILTRKRRP